MSDLGSIAILLSFFITIYSLAACTVAARTESRAFALSGGNGLVSVAFLLLVAVCCLVYELVTLDFSLRYVALNTSTDLPGDIQGDGSLGRPSGFFASLEFYPFPICGFRSTQKQKKGRGPLRKRRFMCCFAFLSFPRSLCGGSHLRSWVWQSEREGGLIRFFKTDTWRFIRLPCMWDTWELQYLLLSA